jgi:farnesyl-diphosphate farnesyltransferase
MTSPDAQRDYCRRILPRVSRTFALGIELLRQPLRDTVTDAYLICRILDTVEDTTSLPSGARSRLLERAGRELFDPELWRDCCRAIGEAFPAGSFSNDEAGLCRRAGDVLAVYHRFPPAVREAIAGPGGEMAAGMAGTVRQESAPGGLRLETTGELEEYCYYVAGTVGGMLTNLFRLDRPAATAAVEDQLRPAGVDFGLGLQLTNIIKGVTDDISRGVSYLPRQLLQEAGVTLEELIEDPGDPRGRTVARRLVHLTLPRLDRGLEYTLMIPAGERDLRLFCGLPLFFAVRTLGRAADLRRVFGSQPLKISRDEVSAIHRRLEEIAGVDGELREEYRREKSRWGY